MQPRASFDLPRAMLQVLALGALIAASFWIFSPFLVPLAWAATMVVATWPVFVHVESLYGGRRAPAVATMTLALLLLLVVPLAYGIDAVVGNADEIVEWSRSLTTLTVPEPPGWLEALPLVGTKTAGTWREYAALSPEELAARLTPYAQGLAVWLVQQVGGFGMLVVNFLLTVVLCAVLYANGETAAGGVIAFARRLAGVQGEKAVHLAGQAVRGVALGVVVTAALQTGLSGLGLVVAGVPFAAFLIALVFVLCIAQVGPSLVMLPVTIWVWSTNGSAWGVAFLVWSLACGLMDNFVRPVLIRRGADLPLLLIFSGVIGGLLAMGVIGLFLGPVVLAVAYTVLVDWVSEGDEPAPAVDA